MSTTSLTVGNMVAAVLQWVILLWLLRRYVYKPLLAAMQKRKENVAKQIGEADNLRLEAQQLRDEQEQALKVARNDANTIILTARREGEEQAKKIIDAAQREASYRQKTAIEEIQHEKDLAVAEIRGHVADLVLLATGKMLEREISEQDQRLLVQQFLQDVEKAPW